MATSKKAEHIREQLLTAKQKKLIVTFSRPFEPGTFTGYVIGIGPAFFRGLPVIPIASYRYACKDVTTGLLHWKEEKVIDQVPLNWSQAMRTWVKSTGLVILAIALTFLYAVWHDRHR